MTDKVDQAIVAVEATIEMATITMRLMGRDDRPASLTVPKDVTELELLNLISSVLSMGDTLRQKRPVIEIARTLPNGLDT